ncbi:MAG: hypothetical protein GX495_16715 [Chloroflexi bacterium]|jgi:hypothetical protein|nr:hypothetical protein [Chloroflexota bacterium]
MDWKHRVQEELNQAERARQMGNEGRARVCARRAAGLIAAEFLERRGIASPGQSAYDNLRFLLTLSDLPDPARTLVDHLLLRVTPTYTLPVDADLIAETRRLAGLLLGEQVP